MARLWAERSETRVIPEPVSRIAETASGGEPSLQEALPPPLAPEEVHLWYASLNQPPAQVEAFARILSPDEQARANRFFFERDRRRFIVGRGVLRTLLGHYVRIPPANLSLGRGPHGKPLLETPADGKRLCFNLAHSHEAALYAIAWNREVGVDLEHLRPISRVREIVDRFFTPRERETFLQLPPEQQLEGFFNGWTRKEAYLKACGVGLAGSLDTVEVSLAPGQPATLSVPHATDDLPEPWSIRALTPADGYVAALVVRGQAWRLVCLTWQPPPYNAISNPS
ncbi:MAG: 4'-phosphopantetheinyl transferase superfamily protein [Chloroflexaceae bacterium]|nr:4'-phosphopantetheinyl transferase superfamily protein [Chloroflexaceae bacterium]